MPNYSAIITTYFNGIELIETIETLLIEPTIKQILVINNGNNNETHQKLIKLSGQNNIIEIIESGTNIGFGAAGNLGARLAKNEWLLFLNPDAKIEAQSLTNLIPQDLEDKKVLIGGLVKNTDNSEQQGARRGKLTITAAILSFTKIAKPNAGAGFWRDFNQNREPIPNQIIEINNISGAFFTIKNADFQTIGGFDEKYFLHLEDIDLCTRFKSVGGKIYFNPHSSAIHIGGASKKAKAFVEWHKYRGFMRYFWKNYNGIGKIWVILIAIPLFFAIIGRLLVSKSQYE